MSIDISYRRIGVITAPVVLTQLSHTAMGVIDAIMVGRLGVTALAAVGLANIITWWCFSFVWGLLSGINTLVAQAEGAGDDRAAGAAFWHGLYMALACGGLLLALWPFVPTIYRWTHATPEVQALAVDYMRYRLLGAFGFTLLLTGDNFFRGLGRTLTPMWCGIAQCVLNCAFNYVLIFGKFGMPAMGAAGAGLGTSLAVGVMGTVLVLAVLVPAQMRTRFTLWHCWRWDPALFRALAKLSLPIGFQVWMEMGGITVFGAVIAGLGDAQLAATNAVIQAWSVTFMAMFALSVGATTLVGNCIGAGVPDLSRDVVRRVLRLGYVFVGAAAVAYVGFPQELMAIFVRGAELARVLPYARPLFTIVTLCLLLDMQMVIVSGALRGAGDTTYPMLVNIGSAWLVLVPLTLVVTPRFGVVGAWACLIAHLGTMAGLLRLRLRGERWLRAPQPRTAPPPPTAEVRLAEEPAGARVIPG